MEDFRLEELKKEKRITFEQQTKAKVEQKVEVSLQALKKLTNNNFSN